MHEVFYITATAHTCCQHIPAEANWLKWYTIDTKITTTKQKAHYCTESLGSSTIE